MATTGMGYGFGAAAAILGVSESRLRYWSQVGFVGSVQPASGASRCTASRTWRR